MNIKESEFWRRAYKLGMANGWCSGQYAIADGDFIVEEDRLNKNSCIVVNSLKELFNFFNHGNWCLGVAVIYKNLCFIQQVDGGDEWLTIKNFDNEAIDFESISFERMEYIEFEELIKRLLRADKEQCIHLNY
jgi:hypothetical protein